VATIRAPESPTIARHAFATVRNPTVPFTTSPREQQGAYAFDTRL
jgi:hypothetical protein